MAESFQHKGNVDEEKNESRAAICVVRDHSTLMLTEEGASEQKEVRGETSSERDWAV